MSSFVSELTEKLEEVEIESNFWKERYLNLSLKHVQLLAKLERAKLHLSKESTIDEENPDNRPRLDQDENFQDPLKLPDPCIQNILKYFSGKELLTLTEVSTHWKNYIESSNFLMNRAMDNVVACFDNDKSLFVYEGSTGPLNRRYKHARAVFPQAYFKSTDTMDHAIFKCYENSFVTLNLSVLSIEENLHIPIKPVSFNKLKKLQLKIYCEYEEEMPHHNLAFERFIKQSSFPEVTSLYYQTKIVRNEFVKEFLCKFPKLKTLFNSNYYDDDFDFITPFEQQPALEYIGLKYFNQHLLQSFSETLSSVYVYYGVDKNEINILLNLPKLEFLRICLDNDHDSDDEDEVLYTQNNKLKTLVVKEGSIEDLHELLLAVPNLKVLKLETTKVVKSTINFLASNMVNLKTLICSRISNEAFNTHSNLQQNEENRFVNANYRIGIKQTYPDFQKTFEAL